jgi:hypothetical protein
MCSNEHSAYKSVLPSQKIRKLLHLDGLTISGVKRLIKENGINHIIKIGKALNGNNLNFQKKEPILKKINIQKSKIDKEKIYGFINQLDILKSKIESRILNDL